MKIQYCLLIGILLLGAINLKATSKPNHKMFDKVEINVLDYPFMNDIANFIRQTDHDKIFPQFDKPQFEAEYCFDTEFGNFPKAKSQSFNANGTYSICVSLSTCIEPYLFNVNGINFHTNDNLDPYFESCKIKRSKVNKAVKNEDAFWYYFWFFEVKDGKVIDAVYFYEPVDDGFDKYDVYDLIHKEYIPYKVWKSRINDYRRQQNSVK